jgi:hypothetical protein
MAIHATTAVTATATVRRTALELRGTRQSPAAANSGSPRIQVSGDMSVKIKVS